MSKAYCLLGGALLLTILSEGLLALLVKKQKSWVWLSVSGNLITNPVANLLAIWVRNQWPGIQGVYVGFVVVLEIVIVLLEAWIYHKGTADSEKSCLVFSAEANGLSFCLGLLLFRII